jgi:hypothetical protein
MRQALEAVMAVDYQADHSPNLREIAHRMGFHVATVRKYCPDLCQAIVLRYKRHWSETENQCRMKQALEIALTKPIAEPLEHVARQLHCEAMILRRYFPDLCRAIVARYRGRFDSAHIEQHLQAVLASEGEVPALHALAREMDSTYYILSHHFTDLCRQISARRYAERRKRHQKRMTAVAAEIRQVVLQLHEKNIYPSNEQVRGAVGDRHILRTKEGRDAWLLTLQELGYPTDIFQKEI